MLVENESRMQDIKNIHESDPNILNSYQNSLSIKLDDVPQCRRGQSQRGRRANRHSPAEVNLVTSTTPLSSNRNNPATSKMTQNIQCHTCQKTFNNSSALAKHKLIHSDERKYTCGQCSKSFKRQDHLNGHMMTHSAKKPYECRFSNCDKSYCDNRSLRRHYDNHHNPSDLQTCPIPDTLTPGLTPRSANSEGQSQIFNFDHLDSQLLSAHSQLSPASPSLSCASPSWTKIFNPYDEPKPIKCNLCDKRFKNMPALNGHMRLHGGYLKKDIIQVDSLEGQPYSDNKIKKKKVPTATLR